MVATYWPFPTVTYGGLVALRSKEEVDRLQSLHADAERRRSLQKAQRQARKRQRRAR